MTYSQAVSERWRKVLGDESVVTAPSSLRDFVLDSDSIGHRIVCVLRPVNSAQVAEIVRIATETDVALYPISTGNNWGYGSGNPVKDDCALIDLSAMDRVLAFDTGAGVVTVEPGVTQRKLRAYRSR